MSTPATVPMLSSSGDGQIYDVPQENMQKAMSANWKIAIPMLDKDGSPQYVPHDRVTDAQKNGWKVDVHASETPSITDTIKKSFGIDNIIKNAGQGLKELGTGAQTVLKSMGGDMAATASLGMGQVDQAQKANEELSKPDLKSKVAGSGHAVAAALPMIGPFAASLGEQAGTGDVGGATARGGVQLAAGEAAARLPKAAARAALLGKTPEGAYESALKPATTIPAADRAQIVKTGLDEAVPVSKAGLQKLTDLIDDINTQIKNSIPKNTKATVNKFAVASRLKPLTDQFETQVNPEGDLNAISDSGNEFLRNQPGQIPAVRAQEIKQGTYRALGKKAYGELKGASIESQKALARGIKEELATQFPELEKLNARDTKLLDLEPVLERAVNRISNHQIIGVGTPAAAAGAKVITSSTKVAAVAATMKAVLDNPVVKSRLAIALNRVGVPPSAAQLRVSNYLSALGAAASGQSTKEATQ